MLRHNVNSTFSKFLAEQEQLKTDKELKEIKNKKKFEIQVKARYERRAEEKLISQAAKKFNLHLHSQNLFKENREYISKSFLTLFRNT